MTASIRDWRPGGWKPVAAWGAAGPFLSRATELAEVLDILGEAAARIAQEQHADWAATDPWAAVFLVTSGQLLAPA